MRLPLAAAIAATSAIGAPAALAATPDRTFPIDGSYKGHTEQALLTTFQIAGKRVHSFTVSVQRFCSDGTTSFAFIPATGLGGQRDAALRRGPRGTRKLDLTVTASTGATARVRGTLRRGWLGGTVVFSDVAALPMGPGAGDVAVAPPGAGATCSTETDATSDRITYKAHWG